MKSFCDEDIFAIAVTTSWRTQSHENHSAIQPIGQLYAALV